MLALCDMFAAPDGTGLCCGTVTRHDPSRRNMCLAIHHFLHRHVPTGIMRADGLVRAAVAT
jgi:hypothetical protein